MKHDISIEGVGYRLRPIGLDDAQFIINIRLEDQDRNQYINPISTEITAQEKWLEQYFERQGDYYFVVENKITQSSEGLIGIYDLDDNKAEWGRWVIKKGSLATAESLDLMFKVAFGHFNLKEVYCRTIAENHRVVSLHDSLPQLSRGTLEDTTEINGVQYVVIEHYVTPTHFYENIVADLEKKAMFIFQRNLRSLIGELEFHHIGLATSSLEDEFKAYRFLGYTRENTIFEDEEQGIRGQFITAPGQPRIELLENLQGSSTLDVWLKNRIKMYHFAYKTHNIEEAIKVLNANKIRLVTPLKYSIYFETRICFLLLSPNFLIELIEQ